MSKHPNIHSISDIPLEDLQSRAQKARALLAQIADLLPGLVHFSVDERKHSNGRLQSGEVPAMKKLLVAAGKHPHIFAALADKDGGKDPKVFEPQPAIDDLDRIAALQELADDAESFAQKLGDTLLAFGSDARDVGVPVHAVINANRSIDPALSNDVAEGMEFYAAHGRSASRARAKNKAAVTASAPDGEPTK
jgi:hypothetical protein